MKYLHSRLGLAGVVIAWPLMQFGACAQKERQFAPSGSGADSAGGMAGEESGGTGGKGGTATGGKGGTSSGGKGGTSSGGKAGSSTGGSAGSSGGKAGSSSGGAGGSTAGKGGATTGGKGGTSGAGNGGNAGQIIDPTCVPTGNEVCDDGVDNDCDSFTDCLTFASSFPELYGAAAGSHVEYTFLPKHADGSYECRAARGDVIPAATAWGACPRLSGDTTFPIDRSVSSTDTTDGIWTTEVRLSFPGGGHSPVFQRQVYIHSSLNSATPCPATADDADYFAAAAADLEDTGTAFDTTTTHNPFIQVQFTPPLDSRYYVYATTDSLARTYSLRRRFAFSDDGHFLLITRTYPSRLGRFDCNAARKRVHNLNGSHLFGSDSYQDCTALVMNTAGAGYCLSYAGGTVASVEWIRNDYGVQVPDALYSPRADNFAWRKIFFSHTMPGLNTHFSPACEVDGCGDLTTLFLPDSDNYAYW